MGSGVTVPERDARPLFTPTRGATLVVAGLLLADALVLWGRVARWESVAPAWVFGTAAGV